MGAIQPQKQGMSDRAVSRIVLAYLLLCAAAAIVLKAATGWPVGSIILVAVLFFLVLLVVGSVLLRPLVLIGMLVSKSVRRERA